MPRADGSPTTTERGYGAAHRAEHARWAPVVAAGGVVCWRCRRLIVPGSSWDLGHDDFDRTVYRGPEHTGCNRGAGARKANRRRGARSRLVRLIRSAPW